MLLVAASLDASGQAATVTQNEGTSQHRPTVDTPMATKMMKQGMMQGDVEKEADKKKKEMQPILEQEEKLMKQKKVER